MAWLGPTQSMPPLPEGIIVGKTKRAVPQVACSHNLLALHPCLRETMTLLLKGTTPSLVALALSSLEALGTTAHGALTEAGPV